jgi:hypothetical protein
MHFESGFKLFQILLDRRHDSGFRATRTEHKTSTTHSNVGVFYRLLTRLGEAPSGSQISYPNGNGKHGMTRDDI